jgi:predicted transglutaminase-like cysteine proteinase
MKKLTLTDANWALIQAVNTEYNHKIKYAKDIDIHKESDYWTFPKEVDGKLSGDCEDISVAILKDNHNIDAYLALCWVETGVYHAVCMVHTDRGAYVLDNRYPMVYHYKDANYRWDKIEMEDGEWQNFS